MAMPENKKETNTNLKSLLRLGNGDIQELESGLARTRSKVGALMSAIRTKIDAIEAKQLELQKAAKEQSSNEPEKTMAEEAKSEKPALSEQKQADVAPKEESKADSNTEIKDTAKPKEEQKQQGRSAQPAQKQGDKEGKKEEQRPAKQDGAKEQNKPQAKPENKPEIGADGKIRRVYVPEPAKKSEPKRSGEKTRVFSQNDNNRMGGGPRAQGQRPQGGGKSYQPGSRGPMTGLQNMPQPMPQKGNGKNGGKNQKNNSNQNSGGKFDDRSSSRYSLIKKGFIDDDRVVSYDENGEEVVRVYKATNRQKTQSGPAVTVIESAVITVDPVPIKTLSEKIGRSAAEIVRKLFSIGEMKTINDSIDYATAELVADEFGVKLEYKPDVTLEETLTAKLEVDEAEDLDNLVERPPVVTIMGHVDHGKTSLLDYIRKSNVTGGEAGGITQHIGAYTVALGGKTITFLDTPGHEAFTSMRARGAQVTDIAILVIAADDGIMPQTVEAINHAKQANVPIIVALNKMDKPGANPDRALQQLTEYGITPEEWGGETPVVKVSAKTGMGVEELLEQILVRAEVEELKANPDRSARGTIIEAKLDKGLGKIATILVQTGTLHVGDNVVAGVCTGKIRAMMDFKGKKVKSAGPSMPVSVTGWNDVPEAGDRIDVVADERFARELAEERRLKREAAQAEHSSVSLNDLFDKISKGELKSVKLIIKADVQGSVEAVKQSLVKLGNAEVSIDIIHSAVGAVKESDVLLAETAGAIIIGFNVRPDVNAKALAAQKKIDIRFYDIIYNAIEDIEKAVKGMLEPKFRETTLGTAEIRMVYKITGVGYVAGCYVTDGKVLRNSKARLVREGTVVYNGEIASLRHGKEDVKEMARGFECGITLKNYQDLKEGDVIESYTVEQINED